MQIDELVRCLEPRKTVLFLGSGTSIESGGLTGAMLAHRLWSDLVGGEPISTDLAEVAGILCNRPSIGRKVLVNAVRALLSNLEPTTCMRALLANPWSAIYTTNYDHVVEKACKAISKPVAIIRSNFDYSQLEATDHLPLLKLHGCLSQDVVDGHNGRMLLTEEDYEIAASYKETLYRRLELDLSTKDVLIIGHSLKDSDVKREVVKAADLKTHRAAPGRIVFVAYERDDDRAQLFERRGITVCTSTLEQLTEAFTRVREENPRTPPAISTEELLTQRQAACTMVVPEQCRKPHNPDRVFHGAEANYGDIVQGCTFARSCEDRIIDTLVNGEKKFAIITGVAGVGKTTLGRRVMHRISKLGFAAWEWRPEFAFRAAEWIRTDMLLRQQGKVGMLFVDECLPSLRQINDLCSHVARHDDAGLRIVLTANHAQWVPRIKSPEIFRHGILSRLSTLDERELLELVTLLDTRPEIRRLVPEQFTNLPRHARLERLRRRCHADMFVCLKFVFSYQSLDQILLSEFSQLDETQQEIYRLVSFLESSCGIVHRQLILRIVDMLPDAVKQRLTELEDLVEEYDIDPDGGLFGWRTRHNVIAKTITQYKYANVEDVFKTLNTVIQTANPSVAIELRMLREMCGSELGINQIPSHELRLQLLRQIVAIIPSERVPRHRLIGALLDLQRYDDAEAEIEEATRTIRRDPPLHRYRVRLHVEKALNQDGLMREDRIALLRIAERMAQDAIERFPDDKRAYLTYADVGDALLRVSGDRSVFHHALHEMQKASERLLDPEFIEAARGFSRRNGR